MARCRRIPSSLFAVALGAAMSVAPSSARAADAPPPAAPPPAAPPPAPPAAGDAAPQVKAALDEIEGAVKAKDEAAATGAVKKLGALYKATQDDALRASILKGLGELIKQSKMPSSRKDALDALVGTEDTKEGWKVLNPLFPDAGVEDTTKWNCDIVNAIGKLHPEGPAVDKLLESFKKAKQDDLAAASVLALGNYHKSKNREHILEEIVKAGKNMVPSRSASKNPSKEAMGRWNTIGPAIGKALDGLTGETVGSPEEWFKKVDEAKKNYKGLFRD